MAELCVGIVFDAACDDETSATVHALGTALLQRHHKVLPLGVTGTGEWLQPGDAMAILQAAAHAGPDSPSPQHGASPTGVGLMPLQQGLPYDGFDLVVVTLGAADPRCHTIQACLARAGVPYVGTVISGPALIRDRAAMRAVFSAHGLPQVSYQILFRNDWLAESDRMLAELITRFSFPLDVLPVGVASELGVCRANDPDSLRDAITVALRQERRAIMSGMPLGWMTCDVAVISNGLVICGPIGPAPMGGDRAGGHPHPSEPNGDPSPPDADLIARIRRLAFQAVAALDLVGVVQVTVLVAPDGEIVLHEVTPTPDLAPGSPFVRQVAARGGLSYATLIGFLIQLTWEHHAESTRPKADTSPLKPQDRFDGTHVAAALSACLGGDVAIAGWTRLAATEQGDWHVRTGDQEMVVKWGNGGSRFTNAWQAHRLATQHGVPAATFLGVSHLPNALGQPFFVLAWLSGVTFMSRLAALPAADRAHIAERYGAALAQVHGISHGQFQESISSGPGMQTTASWQTFASAVFNRGLQRLHLGAPPLSASVIALVETCRAGIAALPDNIVPGMTHGGPHLHNVIVEDGRFRGMIDFEWAAFMDPLVDFIHLWETWLDYSPELAPAFMTGYHRVRPWHPAYDDRVRLYRGMQVLGRLGLAAENRDGDSYTQALTDIDHFLANRPFFAPSGHGIWSLGVATVDLSRF